MYVKCPPQSVTQDGLIKVDWYHHYLTTQTLSDFCRSKLMAQTRLFKPLSLCFLLAGGFVKKHGQPVVSKALG